MTRRHEASKATLRIGDREVPISSLVYQAHPPVQAPRAGSVVNVTGTDHDGRAVVEQVTVQAVPAWNNLRRAWMVAGPDGQPVLVEPQPPPPVFGVSLGIVPPAVKVAL